MLTPERWPAAHGLDRARAMNINRPSEPVTGSVLSSGYKSGHSAGSLRASPCVMPNFSMRS